MQAMQADRREHAEALARAFTEYCVYNPDIWASASQQVLLELLVSWLSLCCNLPEPLFS